MIHLSIVAYSTANVATYKSSIMQCTIFCILLVKYYKVSSPGIDYHRTLNTYTGQNLVLHSNIHREVVSSPIKQARALQELATTFTTEIQQC